MNNLSERSYVLYPILGIGLLICSLLTLFLGDIPWSTVWEGILERISGTSTHWNPLLDERIPRLIVILCTGASLAVSGAVMQAVFQNPLASPSVLGISCGGSLCVVIAFVMGLHLKHPYAIPIAAVGGCLLTLLLIYTLAGRSDSTQLTTFILTSIALSTLLIAVQGAILYALRDRWQLIQTLTEWEAGSTTDRTWDHVHMQLPLTLVGLLGCWIYRHELDMLALGEDEAKNLGVEVGTIRWRLFLCVALLTGGAIAAVGIIAFFGLVLPHLVRNIQGPDNRRLIPVCMLTGGLVLCAMDLLLRTFAIHIFSIGNVSAVLGGIFFLLLLFRRGKFASEYA